MFLFSPKFAGTFSHLPRFKWGCWTLPKCSYFTQMFLILPKTLLKFFSWPKFDEGCWNYLMIPVHSRAVFILPSRAKNNGKIVWDYFAVLSVILPLIWLLFCLSLENRHYLITYECSCILCLNFENFCPNNGQFFSIGDVTVSPASPCRMLMSGAHAGGAEGASAPLNGNRLNTNLLLTFIKTQNNFAHAYIAI